MVAGSKDCEGSPVSLIGDGWRLTERHRRRWELNRDDGSSTATVCAYNGAQRRLLFFFFFDRNGLISEGSRIFEVNNSKSKGHKCPLILNSFLGSGPFFG